MAGLDVSDKVLRAAGPAEPVNLDLDGGAVESRVREALDSVRMAPPHNGPPIIVDVGIMES